MMLILALLVIFQVKHFVADYVLQGKYMLGKFKETGWVLPLSAHCFVHASFTLVIGGVLSILAILFTASILPLGTILGLAAFDFVAHFIMDRIKASPKLLGRYKSISAEKYNTLVQDVATVKKTGGTHDIEQAEDLLAIALKSNRRFWLSLGLDQTVHHLTHYIIIAVLLKDLL